jgi:hypothetical protein
MEPARDMDKLIGATTLSRNISKIKLNIGDGALVEVCCRLPGNPKNHVHSLSM